jgi:hypothetical protein
MHAARHACYDDGLRRFDLSLRTRGNPKQLKRTVEQAATVRRRSSFPPHMKPAYADAKRAFLLPARLTFSFTTNSQHRSGKRGNT